MKQVCVKRVTCSITRLTTSSALLPTDVTAIPEPKSISELPSASTTIPPPAAVTNTGRTWLSPRATLRCLRSSSAREAGPGMSVTIRRCCGTEGPPRPGGVLVLMLIGRQYPWLAACGRGAPGRLRRRAALAAVVSGGVADLAVVAISRAPLPREAPGSPGVYSDGVA